MLKLVFLLPGLLSTGFCPAYSLAQQFIQGDCPACEAVTQAQERFAIPYGRVQTYGQVPSVCPQCELTSGQGQALSIFGQYPAQAQSQIGEVVFELVIDNPQAVIRGQSPRVTVYQRVHGLRSVVRRFVPVEQTGEVYGSPGPQQFNFNR